MGRIGASTVLALTEPAGALPSTVALPLDGRARGFRIPFVTVELTGLAAGDVCVKSQGKEIPEAPIGVPRPIDPGNYEFPVESSEAEGEPVTVTVVEGENRTATIELRKVSSAEEQSNEPSSTPLESATEREKPKKARGSLAPAIAPLSLGVVGAGLGTYFYFDRASRNRAATTSYEDSNCAVDGNCSFQQQEDIKRCFTRRGYLRNGFSDQPFCWRSSSCCWSRSAPNSR